MDRKYLEQLVREAIAMLPAPAIAAMDNVAFVIEEEARCQRVNEESIKMDEVLLGLYEGVPKLKRGSGYFGVLPDKITIFRQPLEELAEGSPAKLKELINEVVWHEVGHHLGFNEEEIRALEQKRKRKRENI